MKGLLFVILGVFVFFMISCVNKNVETMFPPPPPDPCDSISFKKHIKPIIDLRCATGAPCHGSGSINDYTSYDSLLRHLPVVFRQRVLIDKDMPNQPPPLSDEQLRNIECWLSKGYKRKNSYQRLINSKAC